MDKAEKQNLWQTFSQIFRKRTIDTGLGISEPAEMQMTAINYLHGDIYEVVSRKAQKLADYHTMSYYPEVSEAVDIIVDEAIVRDEDNEVLQLSIIDESVRENTQRILEKEFKYITSILNFNTIADDLLRRYYIEGELFGEIIIDPSNKKKGVTGITMLPNDTMGVIYDKKGDVERYIQKIEGKEEIGFVKEQVAYINTGEFGENLNVVYSFLEKAKVPYRQLKRMEESLIIYRIVRAPERRVFKVNVGNLPKAKADAVINELIRKYRQRMVYDSDTGDVVAGTHVQPASEDFWIPVRANGEGTEIDTLPSASNLGEITDVKYFLTKLYKALHIPASRVEKEEGNMFQTHIGDMERDELRFSKFIDKLRTKFIEFLYQIFMTHITMKGYAQELGINRNSFRFVFNENNIYEENKSLDRWERRLNLYSQAQELIGKTFSREFAEKTFLCLSDEERLENEQQIRKEKAKGELNDIENGEMGDTGMGGETGVEGEEPEDTGEEDEQENQNIYG